MSLDTASRRDECRTGCGTTTGRFAGNVRIWRSAESILLQLAEVFFQDGAGPSTKVYPSEVKGPNIEERYRALVEQIPAIVFMAYLDRGIGEAYVSPQIEEKLGFTQREWLEDPVRWYQQIHPKDKDRWSLEAATVFMTGKPLRSAYRVLARDGRVVWFHCEAKLIRRDDGRPWFIHGVAFDITELKKTEEALQEERNVVSAILDTVGALVVVMDRQGRVVRFNRACELTTGYSFDEVNGKYIWDLFLVPEEPRAIPGNFRAALAPGRQPVGRLRNHLVDARWNPTSDRVVRHGFARQRWRSIVSHRYGD